MSMGEHFWLSQFISQLKTSDLQINSLMGPDTGDLDIQLGASSTGAFSFKNKDGNQIALINYLGSVSSVSGNMYGGIGCFNSLRDKAATGAPTLTYGSTHGGPIVFTPADVTIASGAIAAPTKGFHRLSSEDANPDELDTIGAGTDGQILTLMKTNASPAITIKNGTGNIQCGGGDRSLADNEDILVLMYSSVSSAWVRWGYYSDN